MRCMWSGGYRVGCALDDWLDAERELLHRTWLQYSYRLSYLPVMPRRGAEIFVSLMQECYRRKY
jgi:hypothetical protein